MHGTAALQRSTISQVSGICNNETTAIMISVTISWVAIIQYYTIGYSLQDTNISMNKTDNVIMNLANYICMGICNNSDDHQASAINFVQFQY